MPCLTRQRFFPYYVLFCGTEWVALLLFVAALVGPATVSGMTTTSTTSRRSVVVLTQHVWRTQAAAHQQRIHQLLAPGLTVSPHGHQALNAQHPVYNFLIEYYGLKGSKGPRRLARWAPDPSLLLPTTRQEEPKDGILLQGAQSDDFGQSLSLRGALPVDDEGVLYHPRLLFSHGDQHRLKQQAAAYQWYRAILQRTLQSEPVWHCHGLHEWAMQYQPAGAPPPPSAVYQSHLPLRVSRDVINETVERKGISCTHVDALRFFAPAAGPLNHHGAVLQRTDQLRLEQKACVHAHMDLLKIALKLQPFVNATLLGDVLDVALQARRLDVAASPYDASAYGVDVVPVETEAGRRIYRQQQVALAEVAAPIRTRLLTAYDTFLNLAFDDHVLYDTRIDTREGTHYADRAERYAQAEPGSPPWRQNPVVQEKE